MPSPYSGFANPNAWIARAGVDQTWAALRAGAGTHIGTTDASNGNFCSIQASTTASQWAKLGRSIFVFDTSSIGALATIVSATLSIYGESKSDGLSITPNVNVYGATPADAANLAASDFSQIGSTPFCDTPITYAGWSVAYNDFVLNAAGLAAISKTGTTSFGLRNANYDVANVAPSWASGAQSYLSAYFNAQTGTAQDPKLAVTYSTGPGAGVLRTLLFVG